MLSQWKNFPWILSPLQLWLSSFQCCAHIFKAFFYPSISGINTIPILEKILPLSRGRKECLWSWPNPTVWGFNSFLLFSGYCNKITQTGWLKNNRIFLLTALKAESLRSRCQNNWVRALFQVPDLSLCPCMAEGARDLRRSPFIEAQIPLWGLYPHDLITSQRLRLQIPSYLTLRFQYINFVGTWIFKPY